MKTIKLSASYLGWHYTRAFADILENDRNLLWFLWHFFSVGVLAKTLFSPWKRMNVDQAKHQPLGDRLGGFIINTIMRLVGALMRSIIIFFGLGVLGVTLVGEAAVFLLWIVLPALIVFIFVKGLMLIF